MSAIGTKRTWASAPHMSAFRDKADMRIAAAECPLMTLFRHSTTAVESHLDGLLLSPRRKAYQPK